MNMYKDYVDLTDAVSVYKSRHIVSY